MAIEIKEEEMKIKRIRYKVAKAQGDKEKEKCSAPLCLSASVPNNRGFTLMELMVVIAIIVLLAGIMVPNLANRLERAKITKTEADIAAIESAIAMYETDTGRYPEGDDPTGSGWSSIGVLAWRLTGRNTTTGATDTNITSDPNWHGPYIKGIEEDPWKEEYVYIKNTHLNVSTRYPTVLADPRHDYPAANYGGSVAAPDNLSYYIYSRGKNKSTGLTSPNDNEDDINNWDVNKNWREAK